MIFLQKDIKIVYLCTISTTGTYAAVAPEENEYAWCNKVHGLFDRSVDDFKCNRPFLFIIHDNKYRLPLFIGKFVKPE
jgi:serine protease inhibitor